MVMMLAPHKNPVVTRPADEPETREAEGEQAAAVQQEPEQQEPEQQEEKAPALAEAQETE
jgi:hypothetical protein